MVNRSPDGANRGILGNLFRRSLDLFRAVCGPFSKYDQFSLRGRHDSFLSPNGEFLRGLDPKANLITSDLHDGHFDLAVDHDGFILMAAQNKHVVLLEYAASTYKGVFWKGLQRGQSD
jgi:hypothetical protein